MPDIHIAVQNESMLTFIEEPSTPGPWPGIVVIHDALGMSMDVRNQCLWLAEAGFMAAAPDLFNNKTFFSCIFRAIREFKKRHGKFFDKIETARQFLLSNPNSNGKVGVIGFCFGGGSFHPKSNEDARKRIVAFFDKHLK